MDYDLFDDLDEAIALVQPHEPRAAAVLSARYARFVASPGSPADLADLRDILMTLSGIIRRYHVVDRGVTTDQLVMACGISLRLWKRLLTPLRSVRGCGLKTAVGPRSARGFSRRSEVLSANPRRRAGNKATLEGQ